MNPRLTLVSSLLIGSVAGVLVIAHSAASSRRPLPSAAVQETPEPPSTWRTERGGFDFVRRLHAVSADSVWAVGSNTVHFDGHEWRAVDRRDLGGNLQAVGVLPSGYGWVVGGNEEVVPIRDGIAGASVHVPGYRFQDIAVVAEDAVWALARRSQGGGGSAILRLRDGGWVPEWTPLAGSGYYLESIWMNSRTEGWAVGRTAVHFDGATWTEWPLPDGRSASRVSGSAPDDVWAVGGIGPGFGLRDDRRWILHFDGTGWEVVLDEIGPPLGSLAVRGEEGYAMTWEGQIFALRGGIWRLLDVQVPAPNMFFPYVTDVTFVPGASYALATTNYGWIYRLEDETVSLVRQAGTYSAVAMLDERVGWALGDRAVAYDGIGWQKVADDSLLHRAVDVTAMSSSEAWAVGSAGLVLRYANGNWTSVAFPFDLDLVRVAAAADGTVWVLGASQTAEDRQNAADETVVVTFGSTEGWKEVWRGDGAANDLSVVAGRTLVATSTGIWSFDGNAWTEIRHEGALSVGIGPAGEFWAGDAGAISSFDGSAWVAKAFLPVEAQVFAFHQGVSASWAVADHGYVLANTDGHWRIMRGAARIDGVAGQGTSLHDMATVSLPSGETAVWAVGEPDTILRSTESEILERPAVTPAPTFEPMPTVTWPYPQVYFPSVLARPPFRDLACQDVIGLPESTIEQRAMETARYYAAGGPVPEPRQIALGMMTAAEVAARDGVSLVGIRVGERTVTASTCVWWATYAGWFDTKDGAPPNVTPEPDYRWTRLELALFPEDATVFYEGFAGMSDAASPTATAPQPTAVATAPSPIE